MIPSREDGGMGKRPMAARTVEQMVGVSKCAVGRCEDAAKDVKTLAR